MTDLERSKLLEIRLASKRGQRLSPDEQAYCEAMFKKDPKGYSGMNDEINETVRREMTL